MGRQPPLRLPPPLSPGSTIGVCAPAGPVDEAALEAGVAWLEEAGYAVRCARNVRARRGYLAGSDDQRCADQIPQQKTSKRHPHHACRQIDRPADANHESRQQHHLKTMPKNRLLKVLFPLGSDEFAEFRVA